jgi:hypothetical protein
MLWGHLPRLRRRVGETAASMMAFGHLRVEHVHATSVSGLFVAALWPPLAGIGAWPARCSGEGGTLA